jgi:hypothetical protein
VLAVGYWVFAALVFIWDWAFGSPNSFGFPYLYLWGIERRDDLSVR